MVANINASKRTYIIEIELALKYYDVFVCFFLVKCIFVQLDKLDKLVSHKHGENSSIVIRLAEILASDLSSILGKVSKFFVQVILLNSSNWKRITKTSFDVI